MARTRDRVFALVIAVTFFVTTVGVSGLIIWQMVEEKRNQPTTEERKLDNFTPVKDVTTLQKIDLKEGTGEEVKPGDTVTVDYTGAVASTGIVFQSSQDFGQPVTFALDQVIPGWKDGIPGMKVGGKRRLIIPAEMAYGANPPAGSGIPANAALVFDVELHSIGEAQADPSQQQEESAQ